MNTDDLIARLSEDDAPARRMPFWPGIVGAVLVTTAVLFEILLGGRPDLAAVIATPRFAAKVVIVAILAVAAFAGVPRLLRPTEAARPSPLIAVPLILLAVAIVAELVAVPADQWGRVALGSNAALCLSYIPGLSLAALAAFIAALQRGAPSRPVATGALAGLAAGAIGAVFYAFHCDDDSPLFVAIWYTLAIAGVTALGALAGHKFLRW